MKTLLDEAQLRQGIERVAREVTAATGDRPLVIIGVLTGSIVFLADLIRQLQMPLRVGLIQASSYRGAATQPGQLHVNFDLLPDVRGLDVLLLDDIFDTGKTMVRLVDQLQEMSPRSLRTAVLLVKRGRQVVDFRPDYVGFEIPDQFVVGYGLDYNDQFRNLPHLAALEESDLAADDDATDDTNLTHQADRTASADRPGGEPPG